VYNAIVKDHFLNPRNVGELERPDASGSAKNSGDGDHVQLHLQICRGVIEDVRIKVAGCVAAIASASFLSEWLRGKSVTEALALPKEDLAELMGGLPEQKIRCSLTCLDALRIAFEGIPKAS
jgi:NifU-like protein involved in Fe-S cluster formation